VVVNDLGGEVDGTGGSKIADEVVAEVEAAGGKATASYDTVASIEGGQRIFQTAIDRFGGLDILVNNAGILRDRTLYNMEESEWDAVIAVHLKGHYCCTRPFVRYIRDTNRQQCRIINISSSSDLIGSFGQANYGAAKAGIAGFTRVMALELAKYQTTVNAISPGAETRMVIPLMEEGAADPSDPTRGPQLVAPVVTWLAGPGGQEVTGQIIEMELGGIVGIRAHPSVIRSFKSDGLWTQEEFDRVMPLLMDAKRSHDERVEKEAEPGRL
jgi:NAD(P)-dependent dehydrogenase (short-subunit alcohol dehydrogenase family)